MKQEKHPRCYVVAGPNGAGKTTFALKYLPSIASCHDFVNADEIAKGLSPLDYDAGLLKASKIFLDTLKQKIARRSDFAFETTLSGRAYLPQIAEWRKSGWRVGRRIFRHEGSATSFAGRTQHSTGRYWPTVSAKHPKPF